MSRFLNIYDMENNQKLKPNNYTMSENLNKDLLEKISILQKENLELHSKIGEIYTKYYDFTPFGTLDDIPELSQFAEIIRLHRDHIHNLEQRIHSDEAILSRKFVKLFLKYEQKGLARSKFLRALFRKTLSLLVRIKKLFK